MEIKSENGRFTVVRNGNTVIVDAFNGPTNKYRVERMPLVAVAECISWLDETERETFKVMIGDGKYDRGYKYGCKMGMIVEK